MPNSELERAAYMVGDRATQMLIARLESLEDAVGILIHTVETYGGESDEYLDALGTVREMLP
jgi:phage gp37-like protein